MSTIVVNEGRELAVDLEITPGKANKARLNHSPVRSSREMLGVLRAVLFAPEDLALVRGDPGDRRRYLDELATLRRPALAGVRADYDRVVRQRTALLKTAAAQRSRDSGLLHTLDVWDGHLAEHGARLLAARVELVNELRPEVEKAYQLLAPGSRTADIRYRSSIDNDVAGATAVFRDGAAGRAGRRRRDAELDRGVCLVGPHRDDLELMLGDQPAKGFASHGESWSMALSLRLAAYELLRAEGTDPVLLLDDVFAELDSARRQALAAVAGAAEQVAGHGRGSRRHSGRSRSRLAITIGLAEDDNGRISVVIAMIDEPSEKAMDLVRRTLEEARSAARAQGKNIGQGRALGGHTPGGGAAAWRPAGMVRARARQPRPAASRRRQP